MAALLFGISILIIMANLYYFFTNKSYQYSYFCLALFLKLFFVLAGLTIAFAVLYYALSFENEVIQYKGTNYTREENEFLDMLYFSTVTILSIVYGDYVPVGISRFFAIIEASLGLLLPVAYFVRAFGSEKERQKRG